MTNKNTYPKPPLPPQNETTRGVLPPDVDDASSDRAISTLNETGYCQCCKKLDSGIHIAKIKVELHLSDIQDDTSTVLFLCDSCAKLVKLIIDKPDSLLELHGNFDQEFVADTFSSNCNGIYILQTIVHKDMPAEHEFRVIETCINENLWGDITGEVDKRYLQKTFSGCRIYTNEDDAWLAARKYFEKALKEGYNIEYGIQKIILPIQFPILDKNTGIDNESHIGQSSPYRFSVEKAVQAAGVILREETGPQTNYMKLISLLYLAERESVKITGHMIIGDRVVATQRGPVLSSVLDMITGIHTNSDMWNQFINRERYNVNLTRNPDIKKLSRLDIQILQQVTRQHRDNDEWDMANITCELEEYKNSDIGQPIQPRQILEAVGHRHNADQILQEMSTQAKISAIYDRIKRRL